MKYKDKPIVGAYYYDLSTRCHTAQVTAISMLKKVEIRCVCKDCHIPFTVRYPRKDYRKRFNVRFKRVPEIAELLLEIGEVNNDKTDKSKR